MYIYIYIYINNTEVLTLSNLLFKMGEETSWTYSIHKIQVCINHYGYPIILIICIVHFFFSFINISNHKTLREQTM